MDTITHKTTWTIHKYRDQDGDIEKALRGGASCEELSMRMPKAFIGKEIIDSNVALNEGIGELIDIIIGSGSPVKWDVTNAYLGVGNGTAPADATDTGLSGASKTYKAMDSGYPSKSSQTAVWRSTFGSSDANYAWEEYTVVNASSDTGQNLNHKVESKGTKSSGETWTLQLQITFS